MTLDILAVLADEVPGKSAGKCKVQRWLDEIDPETPGLADLVVAINSRDRRDPGYRTIAQATQIIRRLDFDISDRTVAEHRRHDCRCAD